MTETLRVGLVGNSSRLKRVGDAIVSYTGMNVAGIFGGPTIEVFAKLRRWVNFDSVQALAEYSDVIVEVTQNNTQIIRTNRRAQTGSGAAPTLDALTAYRAVVPHPGVVALIRITRCIAVISPIKQLSATIIQCPRSEPHNLRASIDGLTPGVDNDSAEHEILREVGDIVSKARIRTVTAPVTHSDLIMARLSLHSAVGPESVLSALSQSARIVLAASNAGFRSTADVAESFRELPRLRGDQWELFIWRDSVTCDDNDVLLMASYSEEAITIPEILDRLRSIDDSHQKVADIQASTDRSLNITLGFP